MNRKLPRRQGWVWPAIRRALAAADGPMRPVAIYAAVVEDLDTDEDTARLLAAYRQWVGGFG